MWLLQLCRTSLLLPSDPFDSHDDRDDDPEGESVEEHKSVIMHLLSQVRLGMDLTKVKAAEQRLILRVVCHCSGPLFRSHSDLICTCCFFCSGTASTDPVYFILFPHYISQVVLPTFILERRSLLEMYADFFAHPDLFVR